MVKEMNYRHLGDCYRFLAACFYEPETAWLKAGLLDNLGRSMEALRMNTSSLPGSMAERLARPGAEAELAVLYAKLFVGPFELLAPPYGSCHLEESGHVMGDTTLAVSEMYEQAGLQLAKDFKELPDHIAVELEFMHFLIHGETQARQAGDADEALALTQTQQRFLEEFLGPFVASLCPQLKEKADDEFYAALADCVVDLLKTHRSSLESSTD